MPFSNARLPLRTAARIGVAIRNDCQHELDDFQRLNDAGVIYPTPLVWTTTKDDRVGPQHARKFAARMADLSLPYLFFEVIEGGHGSGANIEQRAHTSAIEFTYLARQLMDPGNRPVP